MSVPRLFVALVLCSALLESTCAESVDSNVQNLRGSLASPRKLRSSRKGGSIGGFAIGIILWCLIPPCLWNNERIAIKQAKIQAKARHATVIAEDYNVAPIEELEGHILFVSGTTTVSEKLNDKYFPDVTATDCVKLRRVVEMYQWVETEKKEKRGEEEVTVYEYNMSWKDSPQKCEHDTSGQHSNPPMTLPSSKRAKDAYQAWAALSNGNGEECSVADKVQFGAYYCGDYVVRELTNWKDKTVEASLLSSLIDREVKNKGGPKATSDDGKNWFVYGTGSQLGDYRVRFEELKCGPLSVNGCLAKTAKGYTFVPIIHEDSSMGESCATELGIDDICGGSDSVKYFGPQQKQDNSFRDALANIGGPEMNETEKQQFRRQQSTLEVKDYTDDPHKGDLCCTCCIPQDALNKGMHFIGLEEEYLGVKEEKVQHKDMMGEEKHSAERRHNTCRCCGLIGGVVGAWLIISPITNLLTSNFLIAILGGALISCALQILACACSSVTVTAIISAAWVRHRPRAVLLFVSIVLIIWGSIIGISKKFSTDTTTPAPLGAMTAAPLTPAPLGAMTAAPFGAMTTAAPAGMLAADGAATATAGTCATYAQSCPPGYTVSPPTTPCATTSCAWHECCAASKLKRRLQIFA